MKNSKLIQVPPDGRRAEPGVPGDRGLRGPREPGDPGPAGGGHAPDAAPSHTPRVPMPGTSQAGPGDPQGRAPHADLSQLQTVQGDPHRQSDPQIQGCPPPQEADRGLRGPLEEVTRGGDRGHAPDADITVRETLKTIVKVNISFESGHRDQGQVEYIDINYEASDFADFGDNRDITDMVYNLNHFCWQRAGGIKELPPMLSHNLAKVTDKKTVIKSSPPDVDISCHFLSQAPNNLTEIKETSR